MKREMRENRGEREKGAREVKKNDKENENEIDKSKCNWDETLIKVIMIMINK